MRPVLGGLIRLGPAITMSADVVPGTAQRPGDGRLSRLMLLLTLAAVTSSSLSALSLYQLLALRAEVEGLRSDVFRRREERQEARHRSQMSTRRGSPEPPDLPESQPVRPLLRRRRGATRAERSAPASVSQPCLQMLADNSKATFLKEVALDPHRGLEQYTGIPWHAGLSRGSALEAENNTMLVRQEGFYFVYSQVYYMDRTFAMGHVVIRKKRNVVGDESQYVVLFRCIQTMNPEYPFNTCYTGGIVKLDVGDYVELLIPRPTANVCPDGDSTFLGAVKLA
ncbi:tumor necrosis factor ligand superfamily member 13B isoform 2-T3 [Polymixia lowei]